MKYVYFDGSAGLSGDMILGALIDLGADRRSFVEMIATLRLPVEISFRRVKRGSLGALKVNVRIDEGKQSIRKFADVERIIQRSRFSGTVKDRAVAIFRRLFEAEAKVHGGRFRDSHLHEAGADDALVDIVGSSYLADALDITEFIASPLNVGSGWVKTSHGVLPVPPPAVGELLKGVPVYSAWAENELVTPTGAAIISTLVPTFRRFPEITYDRIGYGAGARNIPEIPNILRAFLGKAGALESGRRVYLIEADIDDASPQLLAHFLGRAFEEGALDATLSPVIMKKNRLGTKLTLLAALDKMDGLIEAVFRETTSIGVRYFPVERRILDRSFETVKVGRQPVGVKIGSIDSRVVNVQPEYDDCLMASRKTRRPLKEVVQRAIEEYYRRRQK